MTNLEEFGHKAIESHSELKADETVKILLSAQALVNEDSTPAEKKLVDEYAHIASIITQDRPSYQAVSSKHKRLQKINQEHNEANNILNEILQDLVSWLSKLDDVRETPSHELPMSRPASSNPQNRIHEIKHLLNEQSQNGLSSHRWQLLFTAIEEQFTYVISWEKYRGSGGYLFPEVKLGKYPAYIELTMQHEELKRSANNLGRLIQKKHEIEAETNKLKQWIHDFRNKSKTLDSLIEDAISRFRSEVGQLSSSAE
ncbi:hypothetical protein [Ectothiorhodospira variabilis]|uniref:hypothetical protein n=1 Tax=Ectothiorhodospira variabilis TaxID=505694 RepID=UPI001EFBDAF4|nr:hypothetical protein [Ectothiorhodospira variabilis]MCG5504176.1 hypothetical protein [Ectothiorhodospira variabilis]MCG5507331.1 hypothetical protein [Ectothiorhodospira variabilis]